MGKILVTGYSGFIGKHLVNELAKKHEVIGLSNTLNSISGIKKIKKDIRKLTIRDVPKNIMCIIHLAAYSDVSFCQKNPAECFDVNVRGTQNLLEISRKIDAKFLYASTSHVYGIPKKIPINENHGRNPISIYGSSKLAGEILSESYAKNYGMDLSIMRFFSIYGPNSPYHLVTSRMIQQILTKKNVSMGNMKPRRDFLFVSDAVDAIKLIVSKSHGFNVYNVGGGKSYSILELYEIIQKLMRTKIPIKSKIDSKKIEINELVADISKIRKLNWKPKIKIEKGLKITLDSFIQVLHSKSTAEY